MNIDIPKIFEGKDVTIVGGGPSLKDFDFSRIKGPTIAVNDSFLYVKSDVLVALDESWHTLHKEELEKYNGYIVSTNKSCIEKAKRIELEPDKYWVDYTVPSANLSGFTAIAVAFYLGAKSVKLLGFDGGYTGDDSNYYTNKSRISSKSYAKRNRHFQLFEYHPIINYSENSTIPFIKKEPLQEYK